MKKDTLTTREEIMMMLKTNGSMTVSEISKGLGITEMAVRRHLNTLERDELIKASIVRQAMGRPTNLYSLTDKAENHFPKAYKNLADDILAGIFEEEGKEKIDKIFERREKKLREAYAKKMHGLTDLEEKVNALVNIQNERGYIVELEKVDNGFLLKEYNCPIFEISRQYNQACDGEKKLFENILNTEVKNLSCMGRGDTYCVYHIKNKK
ncbi:transcriptional regulator [Vulcanibacillus modesticaldus]|uniref:Transcriptional regulator n=1 Tax=Vulcanibacillus modesticaldus TaxID=337097 RepID=A0A1D2YUI6_9BACI|nr:metalloregulator ArsR/SmtB family transcription factor [Vulcanibacillus modesticaldus]OEF99359.1 transcriptional regulator [Vulcanibacillus modesticaldus]